MLASCLVLQLCVLVASQDTKFDSPQDLYFYDTFRKWIINTFGETDQQRRSSPQTRWRMQAEVPPHVPFLCDVMDGRSPEVPDSVHRLRPGDIDMIAALGDSLTAAVGALATNIFQFPIENRGVAAPIGGQGNWRTYLTVPNILKEYNPNLIGYAFGDSTVPDPTSQYNIAESGAMSRDMPYMAKFLINKMKKDPRIDINKHWKLVYIFIGHNDVCSESCFLPSLSENVENHRRDLIETLRILKNNLPRTLVSIIAMANLKALSDNVTDETTLRCYILPRMACTCLMGLQFYHRRAEIYDTLRRYQEVQREVTHYPEFNKKDFTVVFSPVVMKSCMPVRKDGHTDLSFLAIDCFHVSQKAHARFANGLWNNLLEPINNRSETWSPLFERFLCATPKRPFLVTRENSQMMYGVS